MKLKLKKYKLIADFHSPVMESRSQSTKTGSKPLIRRACEAGGKTRTPLSVPLSVCYQWLSKHA